MLRCPKAIVLATHNPGKVTEIDARCHGVDIDFLSLNQFSSVPPDETGETFVENAILKAREATKVSMLPALADDSGLVVDALAGAPGVNSARYAGDHVSGAQHIEKLLRALQGVPKAKRTARFVCVLALMQYPNDPLPIIFQGHWEGIILDSPQGTGGFGYDPVFYLPDDDCTAAELDLSEKAKISHRGQALTHFLQFAEKNINL